MKRLIFIIIITLLVVPQVNAQIQNYDIIYDVQSGKFEGNLKRVKKNTKGDIFLKYYNPFTHTVSVETKGKDNTKSLFKFAHGVLSLLGAKDIELDKEGIRDSISIPKLENPERELTLLMVELRQNSFDCKRIGPLVNALLKDDYTPNYDKLDDKFLHLEAIAINVKKYYDSLDRKGSCEKKVGKYTANADQITINIVLEPREEAKKFGFPVNKISVSKSLSVNKLVTFSSGLMASFNVENDYFVRNTTGVFNIDIENRDNVLPGLTTLAHFALEFNHNWFLSVGGGTTIEGTPHFLSGLSLNPKNSKIFITFGYGIAYLKTLSDGLSTEIDYATAPTIKTKKESQGNFWFGISYKL
jgi:hypothetical protein